MAEATNNETVPHIPWHEEVRLIRQNGDTVTAVGETMLNGNLAILLKQPLLTGEHLRLEALLPNHASHRLEKVSMNCRVSYLVALTHPPNTLRAGLAIEYIDATNRHKLLCFARERIRRQRLRNGILASDNLSQSDSA